MIPVGQGDAGITGRTAGGGNARHHLKLDIMFDKGLNLFTAPSKNKRVPTFKTHHAVAFFGFVDHQHIDVVLGQRMMAFGFAHIQLFRITTHQLQNLR